MPYPFDRNRRGFLRSALLTATVLPTAGLGIAAARPAWAADRPRAEDGHAWDYVNAAEDAAGHEVYEAGNTCANCIFWTGEVADGWGECVHPDFMEVLVNAEGWCSAYVPGQ
jgi:hypothetical protein